LSAIVLFSSALFANSVFADCTYGSYGNNCNYPTDLTIDKEVKNPITNLFVENLGSTDPTFSPGSTVTFKLIIKNTSGETFSPVKIVDQFPDYLTYISSSVTGAYDAGQRRLVMNIENLIAGETREIEISAKVAERNAFANDKSFFCASNYATVTATARPNGDDDTAEFCMTTRINGSATLPVAGFNDLFTVIPFLSLGGIGLALLKKNK
ncbi:MAG: hypothetical protein V1917_04120, partial [Candidatus Gottesmanbacteria bacterium]